eukprot:UN22489
MVMGYDLYRIMLFDEGEVQFSPVGGNGIPTLHPPADMENSMWYGFPCPPAGTGQMVTGGTTGDGTSTASTTTGGGTATTTTGGGTATEATATDPIPYTCTLELKKTRAELTIYKERGGDLWIAKLMGFMAGIMFTVLFGVCIYFTKMAMEAKQGIKDQDVYRIVMDEQ